MKYLTKHLPTGREMMEFSLKEALQDQSVLDKVTEQQLNDLIREYPYASWLHVLMNLMWCAGSTYFFVKAVHVKQSASTGIRD